MNDVVKEQKDWKAEYKRCNEKLKNMTDENDWLNRQNRELTEKLKMYESVLRVIKVLNGIIKD